MNLSFSVHCFSDLLLHSIEAVVLEMCLLKGADWLECFLLLFRAIVSEQLDD